MTKKSIKSSLLITDPSTNQLIDSSKHPSNYPALFVYQRLFVVTIYNTSVLISLHNNLFSWRSRHCFHNLSSLRFLNHQHCKSASSRSCIRIYFLTQLSRQSNTPRNIHHVLQLLSPGRVYLQVENSWLTAALYFVCSTVSQSWKESCEMIRLILVVIMLWSFVCFNLQTKCSPFSNNSLSEAYFLVTSSRNVASADVSQGVEGQMETEMCPAAQGGSGGAVGFVSARPWERAAWPWPL